jgi:two-component system sensor histidine kinase HydH
MVIREQSTRRLYLEYEAYRASAVLLDEYRESPVLNRTDERILGFGLYGPEGKPLVRSGTAPELLDLRGLGEFSGSKPKADSFVLARPLGPGAGSMPGMGHQQGMMRGMGRFGGQLYQPGGSPIDSPPVALSPGGAEGNPLGPPASQLRALWIEYGLGGFNREQALLYGGAATASLALAGIYFLLLILYRRNALLAKREFENRELVQLGEAARTLVHEIKNPLGIIRVQAASLRRLDPANAVMKAAEKAAVIDEEVLRLANLADRIREFLKGGEGEPREIELGPWLTEFAARYNAGDDGPEVTLGEAERRAKARIDPDRLSLALDNLVRNAREACPEGPAPEIGLTARGRQWEISVSDRGGGVAPELAERLFEPFFTTKQRGSGIGLALARRVARAAGGELEYRPRSGGGSIFSILLPMPR